MTMSIMSVNFPDKVPDIIDNLRFMLADEGCFSYVEQGSTVEVLDPYGCLVLGLLRNASVCAKSVSGAERPGHTADIFSVRVALGLCITVCLPYIPIIYAQEKQQANFSFVFSFPYTHGKEYVSWHIPGLVQ
jgi:hypothetical protein